MLFTEAILRFLLGTRGKFTTNRMVDSKGRGNFVAPSRKKCFPRRDTSVKNHLQCKYHVHLFSFIHDNLHIATTLHISRYSKRVATFKYRSILFLTSSLHHDASRCIGYRLRVTEGGTRLAGSVSRNKTKAREVFECRTISHAVTMGRVEWLYNGNTRHEASLHVDNSTEIGIYHRWLIMESRGEWCPFLSSVSRIPFFGFFQILYGWFVIFLSRMSMFFFFISFLFFFNIF